MYGQCHNCKRYNHLTNFKVNGVHVCFNCLAEFNIGEAELRKLQGEAIEHEKLRQAFGRLGEIEEKKK